MITKLLITVMAFGSLAFTSGPNDLEGVKCLVNPNKAANKKHAAKHMDGEVYFCCGGCKSKFEKDAKPYVVKANHQLALTGQYVQKGCPFSGGKVADGVTAKVGGVEVGFCCGNCQGKVSGAADLAAKADLVFTDKAFAKGFEKKKVEVKLDGVKCLMMPKRKVKKTMAADYRGGKVYFCCSSCVKRFKKDKKKYAVKANHHLVKTGQFKQKGCPISGGAVDGSKTVKVNGVDVSVCCGNCKSKIESAPNKDAKAELVFADKAFEKAFEKK